MRIRSVAALSALLLLVLANTASARSNKHDADLREYARGTWASFVAMTDERTGLPADTLRKDGVRSVQTSTTNIGAYMWSAVVARRLGLLSQRELVQRLSLTLSTLEKMERSKLYGNQYFNWYDHRTGEKLTYWPPDRERDPNGPNNFRNWLSSVDNGWLAVGLRVVQNSVPQLSRRAGALYESMDFGVYYVPDRNLVRFHIQPETHPEGSPCCYDTVVSESRIVDYIGIARGQLPPKTYFQRYRTFPDNCDWSWLETRPVGVVTRRYYGVDVSEGAFPYRDSLVVPSWGGSMFEALMVDQFVPEDEWAPTSWRINHPLTVRAQMLHGLLDAGYGYWGFSPANVPEGNYSVYGVDAIGSDPGGNPSNEDRTLVDHGYPGCPGRPALPDPPPSAYTNGVVTPHAAALALRYAPDQARENLSRLARNFPGLYGPLGFRDSVNVQTKRVSDFYLSLDQGMLMAALGNELTNDVLRRAFGDKQLERGVRPVIGIEQFSASPPHR